MNIELRDVGIKTETHAKVERAMREIKKLYEIVERRVKNYGIMT